MEMYGALRRTGRTVSSLAATVKASLIRRLGHVHRTSGNRGPENALYDLSEGQRRRG